MKVSADPIIHRDGYTAFVENEVMEYFRDVLFGPLFGVLDQSGIRENSLEDWGWFPRGWGSLGIPRCDMPQIRGESRMELLRALDLAGVRRHLMLRPVASLQPTQDKYSPTKVEAARRHTGPDRAIIVSRDGHIIDGHHQWVAKMLDLPTGKIEVEHIEMGTRELLDFVLAHPDVTRANERPTKERSALWDAILLGIVWYSAGAFTGKFNAAISRELRTIGAKKTSTGFYLSPADLPMMLRGVISLSVAKSDALHKAILALLDQIETNLPAAEPGITFSNTVDTVVEDLQKQLEATVSSIEGLPVPPPTPDNVKEGLREKLAQGTARDIKKFSLEETKALRAKVRQNLSEGGRTDRLVKIVETEFGVTQRKARVIAESETSQLVSDFRKERYESLGSEDYIWSTSHDEKVRPTHGESNNHRVLDGRRFPWASPPVVDSATGRRCHPGEDFGPCRCVARPLFNFS